MEASQQSELAKLVGERVNEKKDGLSGDEINNPLDVEEEWDDNFFWVPIPHGEWMVKQREYAACTAELREIKGKLGLA